MPSEFVSHFTHSLVVSTSRPPSPPPSPPFSAQTIGRTSGNGAARKATLHDVLVKLNQGPVEQTDVYIATQKLRGLDSPLGVSGGADICIDDADAEESALEEAVVAKLAITLYSDALDTCLAQATQVESEAEWWADVEHSSLSVSLYLLQTLPQRISNVAVTIVDALRRRRMPINMSTLSPSSLRSLFSSPGFSIRPSALTTAFFPYLRTQQGFSTSILLSPPYRPAFASERDDSSWDELFSKISHFQSLLHRIVVLPLVLTRQECRHKRKSLETMRDQRAELLGQLAQLRTPLGELVNGTSSGARINGFTLPAKKYTSFLNTLHRIVAPTPATLDTGSNESPLEPLEVLCNVVTSMKDTHAEYLKDQKLIRPTRLTRLWPTALIVPPLSICVYSNYTYWIPATVQMLKDAKETLNGFIEGWLVEPLVGVLRSVRAGGASDVLIHAEGVAADLESLERMTLSLARDSLNYTTPQLELLAEKVRLGDLTPVMQAYEDDIRTPIRSALTGSLLRTVLIQVQKAKVDIDQALSGIDKLLKSQELTFAFVGVAPALTVVYVLGGFVRQAWGGSVGKGRWGGRKSRRGVWDGLRRVERLLIRQPPTAPSSVSSSPVSGIEPSPAPLAPLPTGLLILTLTQLRSYALHHLPTHIREPFLEDLGDLEDPTLGRDAKLRVVERMWRCWGSTGHGVAHA